MAYRGLAAVVIAKRNTESNRNDYSGGVRSKRVIRISVTPVYEDISDYEDINETEEKKVFAYAEISMNAADSLKDIESMIFGSEATQDSIVSKDTDIHKNVGVGWRVMETIGGAKRYIAIWIHNVSFTEDSSEHNTRGDSVIYDTSLITGKAIPDNDGSWRTKKVFATSDEADSWIDTMAGIKK